MKKLSLWTAAFLLPFILFAQNPDTRAIAGGGLQFGIPAEAFRENLTNTGVGGGFNLLFRWAEVPLYVGVDLGIMKYDGEVINQAVNIGGFLKDYELRTNNNILTAHLSARLQPEGNGPVRPYLEGMIGTKGLFTVTNLVDITLNGNEVIDTNTDEVDFAFSYGLAVGLVFNVFRNDGIGIDLRCAYLPGGNASYLVRRTDLGAVVITDPIDAFEKKNSPTTLIVPQIGFSILLSRLVSDEADYDEY